MATLQKQQPILYCVQQACLQLGLAPPAGVYDSQDDNAILMGAVANLAGILVTDDFNWQDLQEVFTVTGDGVQTQFPLPVNFSSFVDNTGWSSAMRRPVVVLNAQRWAAIQSWLSQSFFVNPACRIYRNNLEFMSPPALGDTITFQYRVCDWVIDGVDNSLTKPLLTINADIPRFDWLMMTLAIKVKWMEQKGLNTLAAMKDLSDRYFQLTYKDEVAPILHLSGPGAVNTRYLDNLNVPDTNIGF